MKKILAVISAAVLLLSCSGKQAKVASDYQISYEVSFDTTGKYLNVDMNYIPSVATGETTFRLPVWAPGYYIVVDYPKYLMDFNAADAEGNPLKWDKLEKNGWTVENAKEVHVSYRVLADSYSVAESRMDGKAAFVAPNGVFMHVENGVNHPVTVKFNAPANWTKTSTALEKKGDNLYYAPDFDVLYDCPLLFGNHYVEVIEHNGHSYEFAVETPKGWEESPMAEDFLKAVDQAIELFGDTAYDSYTLLLMGAGGGGLEHQASQADYTSGHWDFDTRAEYLSMLKFLTHEFFHNYNVKAIRPAELVPFDYNKENYTTGLWVSEGVTCFYESTMLMRAGIISEQEHFDYISGYIRDTESTPGRQHMSLRSSSYDIWLNFFNRNSNAHDAIISYYVKGPVVAFLLDTEIRTATNGEKSLDDVMRLLYNNCYKQGKGFTEEGLWQTIESVGGAEVVQKMRRYVDTTDELDYESILEPAGLTIDRNTWKITRK